MKINEKICEIALNQVFSAFPDGFDWTEHYDYLKALVSCELNNLVLTPHAIYDDYEHSELLAMVDKNIEMLEELQYWMENK